MNNSIIIQGGFKDFDRYYKIQGVSLPLKNILVVKEFSLFQGGVGTLLIECILLLSYPCNLKLA